MFCSSWYLLILLYDIDKNSYHISDNYSYYILIIPSDPCDLRPRIIAQPQKNVKTREENYKGSHKSRLGVAWQSRRDMHHESQYHYEISTRRGRLSQMLICHHMNITISYVSYIITVNKMLTSLWVHCKITLFAQGSHGKFSLQRGACPSLAYHLRR